MFTILRSNPTHRRLGAVVLAAGLAASWPAGASAQPSRGGGSIGSLPAVRTGRAPSPIDQSQSLSTHGVPKLGAATTPAERLVPERRVRDPLTGREIVIPAHYERRITDQQWWVPPLTGYGANHEGPVHIQGGSQPPADQRQAP
ncbi:MAG: hypothetical protein ABW020_11675 [Candidatus Rokuibacteriota bacterium]